MRCTAALLSRTYVFAAFDGRWPGVTFLILALSGKLALGPYSARYLQPSNRLGIRIVQPHRPGEVTKDSLIGSANLHIGSLTPRAI
jgi:hypothetical protein